MIQAVLPTPMFETRWRWNVSRALLVDRMWGGKRTPAPLLRMRADDLLAEAFPDVVACGETLDPGDIEVPMDHPIVAQTIEDCLHEAMDVDGLIELLRGLRDGSIERVAIDTPEPSAFARSILNARPYAFLDDAPLEERRTQAVLNRRVLDTRTADELGVLSPEAVARVREEAWPQPDDAEEVHEALGWMGYVTEAEAAQSGWSEWLADLAGQQRVVREGDRWFAVEATRDEKAVLQGRMEALGPVFDEDPLFARLEQEGVALKARLEDRWAWCDRRLLARIQRYTLERPAARDRAGAGDELPRLPHLLAARRARPPPRGAGRRAQGDPAAGRLRDPGGHLGEEDPGATRDGLPPRLARRAGAARRDRLGPVVGATARRRCGRRPSALMPRADLPAWLGLSRGAAADEEPELAWTAAGLREELRKRGAAFTQDLERAVDMLPSHLEEGLSELIARGQLTNDSFAALRRFLAPSYRRRATSSAPGRWSLLENEYAESPEPEFVARALLDRYGVVFRKLLERERIPVAWRELLRVYRTLELRGEVRGGRFVSRFAGEQYALPEAVRELRRLRRSDPLPPVEVSAADPLNLVGILTPGERVPQASKKPVAIGRTADRPDSGTETPASHKGKTASG